MEEADSATRLASEEAERIEAADARPSSGSIDAHVWMGGGRKAGAWVTRVAGSSVMSTGSILELLLDCGRATWVWRCPGRLLQQAF